MNRKKNALRLFSLIFEMLSCTASEEFTQKNAAEASAHTPLSPSEPSREHTARAEIPQGSTGGKFIYYLASETLRRVSAGVQVRTALLGSCGSSAGAAAAAGRPESGG